MASKDSFNARSSFTSASSIPYKTVVDETVFQNALAGRVPCVHLQVSPTNVCNLNCPWCSCSDRDKKLQLDPLDLVKIVEMSKHLGVKAFTVTGGGEPLLHPYINEFLWGAEKAGIKIGLVSNGVALDASHVSDDVLRRLTWSRISFGDHRKFEGAFEKNMRRVAETAKLVDWAFSYVVGEKINPDNVVKVVKLANELDFTHVRIVADIYNPDKSDVSQSKKILEKAGVSDEKVIYQQRDDFTPGAKNCWISLLKPIIAADGWVYPCCGVQYSMPGTERDFVKSMRMCHYTELEGLLLKQKKYDGSRCTKCYYPNYNNVLENMLADLKHKEFV